MSFIAIIDYEMGNLRSVEKAFQFIGAPVRIVRTPAEAEGASGLMLPGVGNFGDGMLHLNQSGFRPFVLDWIGKNKPFLGVCLGMQMLMEGSEEAPGIKGLGVFAGTGVLFPEGQEKVPHMGWNSIRYEKENPFLKGVPQDSYFYFVHSYYVKPSDPEVAAAQTHYILDFASALSKGNLFATQFHPEKSQDKGLTILRNFVELSNAYGVTL